MFLLLRTSNVLKDMVRHARLVQEGANLFCRSLSEWETLPEFARKIKQLEVEADSIVHAIGDEVEQTFILPLDKEDIHEFVDALDDILDNVEEATNRMTIYHLQECHSALPNVAELIVAAVGEIEQGVRMIRDRKYGSEELVRSVHRIHDLENQGDRLHRSFLAESMGNAVLGSPQDLVILIKWKEIFQALEDTLDRCEDMATLFERLRIKYS